MADFADDAERTEELFRQQALSVRKESGPPACGACHYCSETVAPALRFCDAECRDGWEGEQRARKRAPKIDIDGLNL